MKRYGIVILASLVVIVVFVFIVFKVVKKDCSEEFAKPIDVDWEGKIIAQMGSGTLYGIERIPPDKKYVYFYAGQDIDKAFAEKKNVGLEGKVRVKGKWIGITDGYKNTIFGRCVPHVEITTIENIK